MYQHVSGISKLSPIWIRLAQNDPIWAIGVNSDIREISLVCVFRADPPGNCQKFVFFFQKATIGIFFGKNDNFWAIFLKNMSIFWQLFHSQMAICRRVRFRVKSSTICWTKYSASQDVRKSDPKKSCICSLDD